MLDSEFEGILREKDWGKRYDCEVTAPVHSFIGWHFDRFAHEEQQEGCHSPEGRRARELQKRGGTETGLPGQGESLGQRVSSKGSTGWARPFYQWATAVRWSLTEYGKQADAKWLKICLFGLLFKKNCCSITVVCIFSPPLHPTPAKPTSLLLGFVHVSFIVVPENPFPYYPLPTPLWLLLDCS